MIGSFGKKERVNNVLAFVRYGTMDDDKGQCISEAKGAQGRVPVVFYY